MAIERSSSEDWQRTLDGFERPEAEREANYASFSDLYDFVDWGNELTRLDDLEAMLAIEGLTLQFDPLDITD